MDEPTPLKTNRTITTHKVFDVAKPGKSVPSQNARPAILTQSALPQDPMVSTFDQNSMGDTISIDTEELFDEPDEIKERSTKSLIEPVEEEAPLDALIPSDNEEAPINGETTEPLEAKAVEEAPKIVKHTGLVVEPIVEKPDEAPKPTQETDDDLDEINEFAGQAAAKTAKKTEDEAEQKRLLVAQELIDSKKYIVPIGTRRGHTVAIWIGLLVIVVAGSAAGYWYLAQ